MTVKAEDENESFRSCSNSSISSGANVTQLQSEDEQSFDSIEEKDIAGNRLQFYVLRLLDTEHKIMVPVANAKNIGLRAPISEDEIKQLSRKNGRLKKPLASDQVEDASFGRKIYLRRTTGAARVTIFEGGHEGIAAAAVAWSE